VVLEFLGALMTMNARHESRWHRWLAWASAALSAVTALCLFAQLVAYGIVLLLATIVVIAAAWVTKAPPADTLPDVVEANAAKMAGVASEVTVNGVSASTLVTGRAKEMSKIVRKWVVLAKLRWGHLQDTRADRTCLARWLAEEMVKDGPEKEKDLRHKDRLAVVQLAVEMFFVPTAEELLAQAIRRSAVVQGLKSLRDNELQ